MGLRKPSGSLCPVRACADRPAHVGLHNDAERRGNWSKRPEWAMRFRQILMSWQPNCRGRKASAYRLPSIGSVHRLIARRRKPQFLHRLLDRKRTRPLPRWKLNKTRQVLPHDALRRDNYERMLDEPSHVVARLVLRPLERIRAQIEQHRKTQLYHRLLPDIEAFGLLFQEHRLPLFVAKAGKVAIVGPIEELAALVRTLAREQIALVVAVQVNREVLSCRVIALQKLVLDVGLAGCSDQSRRPVLR